MRVKVIILGLIYLLTLGSVLSAEKKREVNSWRDYFPDHLETAYIIMKDGKHFKHTSQSEIMIDLSIGMLEEKLKEIKGKNYSIKEIKIVIHNHRNKNSFSPEDYRQYSMLKKYGFKGLFLMYCHRTNKTYDIEDEEKSK